MISLYNELWNKPTSHVISNITPNDKNIEVRVILLDKLTKIELKNGDTLTQYLIADGTGCIKCNFYGEIGELL